MRYPTPPCEGVCALNHYCAITRVDYNEFRQCLETAASALASSSKSSGSRISHLTLLLSVIATLSDSPQRRLLIEWLHHFAFRVPRAFAAPLIKIATHVATLVIQCLFGMWLYWTGTTTAFPSTASSALIGDRKSRRCTATTTTATSALPGVYPLSQPFRILIMLDYCAADVEAAKPVPSNAPNLRCRPLADADAVVIGNVACQIRHNNKPSIAAKCDPLTTWMWPKLLLLLLPLPAASAKGLAPSTNTICQILVNNATTRLSSVKSPNAERTTNCCRPLSSSAATARPAST